MYIHKASLMAGKMSGCVYLGIVTESSPLGNGGANRVPRRVCHFC